MEEISPTLCTLNFHSRTNINLHQKLTFPHVPILSVKNRCFKSFSVCWDHWEPNYEKFPKLPSNYLNNNSSILQRESASVRSSFNNHISYPRSRSSGAPKERAGHQTNQPPGQNYNHSPNKNTNLNSNSISRSTHSLINNYENKTPTTTATATTTISPSTSTKPSKLKSPEQIYRSPERTPLHQTSTLASSRRSAATNNNNHNSNINTSSNSNNSTMSPTRSGRNSSSQLPIKNHSSQIYQRSSRYHIDREAAGDSHVIDRGRDLKGSCGLRGDFDGFFSE